MNVLTQSFFSWIRGTQIEFPGLGLKMNPPVGFNLGSVSIHFYGVIIALGLMLAVIYGLKRGKHFGLKEDDILDGVLWIVPFAIICARAYYCIFEWDMYKDDPISGFYVWKGGLAIYGGIIGAALGIILHCKIKKISLPALLDVVAIGFLVGQFIGRWGNFMNREAFGSYCDNFLAMRINAGLLEAGADATPQFLAELSQLKSAAIEGQYQGFYQVHPTFLYESLWNFVGFIALHFLSKKRQYDGQIALGYVAWYGLGRTFIEGLRMDSLYIGSMRVSQLIAACTCFIAVAVLLWNVFRKHDRQKLFVNVVAAREAAALEEAEEIAAEAAEEAEEAATEEVAEEAAEEAAEETEETTEEPTDN